jgi:hypothetical protein
MGYPQILGHDGAHGSLDLVVDSLDPIHCHMGPSHGLVHTVAGLEPTAAWCDHTHCGYACHDCAHYDYNVKLRNCQSCQFRQKALQVT